ncbi:MAG: fibrobacter succinogenes major paralogous domain-containing protein [Bacteroidetes bacterium]|nr:fibrobacter succinogenes major paralogous domain-containing protein [Bacteroidota bacterium]
MKLITTTILAVFTAFSLFSQTPHAFKYQSVVRNNSGEIIANQTVSFRISILQGNPTGTAVFVETQQTTTNDYGLANLEIGNGIVISGIFADIDWGADNYFLQIEIDETGNENYQVIGVSQLLSVPYSLYSESTGDTTKWQKSNEIDLYYKEGKVGIGTESPEGSALLDLDSDSEGFLLPRLTSDQITAIQLPANGLLVYNTDLNKLFIFVENQAEWREISYGALSIPTNSIFEIGTGGSCNNTVVIGDYMVGGMLTSLCYVSIEVNVISIGYYNVSTDTINGYSFIGEGTFTETGIQAISLSGYGIPLAEQTDLFNAIGSNNGGACTFSVYVNPTSGSCGSLISDIDGNTYGTVQIGTQCWMTENLRTTTYRNGVAIPYVPDNSAWANLEGAAYVWYDQNITWKDIYGALYNWHTVSDQNGLCPTGWHVPSIEDIDTLKNFIGTQSPPGNVLKSCRQVNSPLGGECNTNEHPRWDEHSLYYGTDDYGFGATPGGLRSGSGTFNNIGLYGYWWCTDESSIDEARRYMLGYAYSYLETTNTSAKKNGLSVRCIRND